MATASEHRLYPIKSHDAYGFHAGFLPDGRQVLMGLLCPNLCAFVFDAEGNLLHMEERPLEFMQDQSPPYDIYDLRIETHIAAWQAEMDFRPGIIRVTKFFVVEQYIGIEDYTSSFEEALSDPGADEEEKEDVRESIRLWDEAGQFVLYWGNDYWLDASGEVTSS